MTDTRSNFLKVLASPGFGEAGLILMDDGGSTIRTVSGLQERKTWVAVLIPPNRAKHAVQQMDSVCEEFLERYGATELHAHEVFQRKNAWSRVPIGELKAIVAAIAEILRLENFPIVVQTLWEGNESLTQLLDGMSRETEKKLKRISGLDLRVPGQAAFMFCLWRCRNFIEAEFPVARWEIFADVGIKKAGQTTRVPIQWGASELLSVHFEDSKVCKLIQLADFSAYFLNRSQQIANSDTREDHEEELLDILGKRLNYVNIPYHALPRQQPMAADQFRVACVTSTGTTHKLFDNEAVARKWAAEAIHDGTASQVAVEKSDGSGWALVETRSHRN